LTNEETYVEEFFVSTYSRDSDGRFVVKLSLNSSVLASLDDWENVAKKRLLSMEKKFEKSAELRAGYVDFMNEYIELRHMKRATSVAIDKKRMFHQTVIRCDY